MKRLLFAVAVFPVLFAACSGDEKNTLPDGDELVNVSFSAMLDQAVQTRGVTGESDGTQATQLYVAVYNASNNLIEAISKIGTTGSEETVSMSGKAATVNFQLVKGQTYSFAFWAQHPNATAGAVTFNPSDGKVTVDYSKITANDLTLDAFTAHENNVTVTGPIAKSITLKRPWAQLNYGSTDEDWNAAVAAGITVAKSKVTIDNVYTTLNLLDGTVSNPTNTDIILDANTIPASANPVRSLTVGTTTYNYIGLNYLLVGNEGSQSLIKADLQLFKSGDDTTPVNTLSFSNVPVQRNYRTNIVGNLLTSQVQFNVSITPEYEEPDYVVSIADQAALDATIDAINEGTAAPTAITLAPTVDNATFDFSGLEETLMNTPISVAEGKTVTISNLDAKKNDNTTPALTVGAGSTVNIVGSKLSSADGSATDVRAVNVYSNAVVHISGTSIDGGSTAYSRGLNLISDGAEITIDDDSDVKGTYAINLPSSAVNNVIVVNSATIEGWCVLNIWNSGNKFEFNNCTLKSLNDKPYNAEGWNDFAAFKFNTGSSNNTVKVNDCNVDVKSTTGNRQFLCSFTSPTDNSIYFEGNTSINAENTNTLYTNTETNRSCWYMNNGLPGFTLVYGDDVTFSGEWAGADENDIDRN
mgnify:CR=1 FL=1